jgi:hypothetical protein
MERPSRASRVSALLLGASGRALICPAMPAHPQPIAAALLAAVTLLAATALGGCGKAPTLQPSPGEGTQATATPGAAGTVGLATANTTRIGGSSPAVDAASVARAIYPGVAGEGRPQAVVLVDGANWPAALAASVLEGKPLRAPLLYSEGIVLPSVSAQAVEALQPTGDPTLGGAQAIRVGESAAPTELRISSLDGAEPATLAVAVERLQSELSGHAPRNVIVTASDAPPALSEPAAGLAALTGAPILFVTHSGIPTATSSELARLGRHISIYVVGPPSTVGEAQLAQLARYGTTRRIAGPTPASNALAVARFSNGSFGWGAQEAGHGFVFAQASRPLDGPAAASLAAAGDFAPLLLLEAPDAIPGAVAEYLGDLQPGYPASGPVHGVYNHGWLIGDGHAIAPAIQARLDAMLAVNPHKQSSEPAAPELESTASSTEPPAQATATTTG